MINCDNAAAILTRLMEVTGTSPAEAGGKARMEPPALEQPAEEEHIPGQ